MVLFIYLFMYVCTYVFIYLFFLEFRGAWEKGAVVKEWHSQAGGSMGFHLWFGLYPAVMASGAGCEHHVGAESRNGIILGHGRGPWAQCPDQGERIAVLSPLATACM